MKKLAYVAAVGLALAAYGSAQAQNTVIAVAGPMTGANATFGDQMRKGVEAAVKTVNAKGGVLGKQLSVEVGDDACDPRQAVAVANQLAAKKAVFVSGHYCSGSSIPASEVYAEEGLVQISPASTNPLLTERGDKFKNVFRVCGRDDKQGATAGKYLSEKYKDKPIAIIHDKSAYGKGLADETKKALNAAGVKEALYEAVSAGDKDFTALVTKMKQAGVAAIYFGGYHTEAGLIVRQSREQGLGAVLISGDALMTNEFWSVAGPAGEGTLMTFAPDPRDLASAKDVVASFKSAGFEPEGYTLNAYATIQIFAEAAAKAKSVKSD